MTSSHPWSAVEIIDEGDDDDPFRWSVVIAWTKGQPHEEWIPEEIREEISNWCDEYANSVGRLGPDWVGFTSHERALHFYMTFHESK